jgi:hypothetical protein
MEGIFETAERHPLGQGLEVIDRFRGFDLDDRQHLSAAVWRQEHDVGVNGVRSAAYCTVLLSPGVDPHIETTAKLGLEEADDPVVFELLPDWPDEDGAHKLATITWMLRLSAIEARQISRQ